MAWQTCAVEELSPYVRDIGLQHQDSWKNRNRIIYDHAYYYCIRGEAYMQIEERLYRLNTGTLTLVPPGVPHSFWVDEVSPGELYFLHFDFFFQPDSPDVLEYYVDMDRYVYLFTDSPQHPELIRPRPVFQDGTVFPEHIHVEDTDTMEFLFRRLHTLYVRQPSGWRMRSMILMLEILEAVRAQTASKEDYTSATHRAIAAQIKQFIHANYRSKLDLERMTESTGMSADYASRIFKRIIGLSPTEYLIRYRISKAKQMMFDQDLSIGDIAFSVGFEDENYFCRIIKKYEGRTPARLRQSLISGERVDRPNHEP